MGGIVIDYHLNGWAKENESRIRNGYSDIYYVGELPDLPRESLDPEVAAFCMARGCDLLTSDKEAYISWLEKRGGKEVHVSLFDMYLQSDQPVPIFRIA